MAKVAFSKLEVKVLDSSSQLYYCNSKGEKIYYDVQHYLPIENKMTMISNIINQSIDDNGYYNPIRLKIFTVLEIVYNYTNLNFTAKQKENPFKLYDQLVSTGIFQEIKDTILTFEQEEIESSIKIIIDNIYSYKNSVMGILDTISTDYSNLKLDATNIHNQLADPDNMDFLRSVLSKLG